MILLIFVVLLATDCLALYPSSGNVIELTSSNFEKLVIHGDEVWIVEFFASWCGHCQNLVPEYTKAANALMGVVRVGAVNAVEHNALGEKYGVRGFPTIVIFGANKLEPEDYNGKRSARDIVEASLKAVRNKVNSKLNGGPSKSHNTTGDDDVIELTDTNFDKLVLQSEDPWLVEFFAPWCVHCKNLQPHWAKAATLLKSRVKLGALDATVHQTRASRYGVAGYPTIKFFPAGKKDPPEDYDGGRKSDDIVNWVLDKLAENMPVPEVLQIVDEKTFRNACEGKALCVVAVLPQILDCQSECRNQYIKLVTEVGVKFKKNMWGWLWSEAGSQPELESSLDIGGFGYPAMAVINVKRMKFSIFKGAFSKDSIYGFLRDLSYGKSTTAPIRGHVLPKISAIVSWDGRDGVLPEEENVDLSDVDLDKKDEL